MKDLVFATGNRNKLREVSQLTGPEFRVISLEDISCLEEIPETSPTIEGNASQKAWYVYRNYGYDCFADDSGMEVEYLNGAPGVYSARYGGEEKSAEANIRRVLAELDGVKQRKARFKTVISLVQGGKETQFEGVVNGVILEAARGAQGFGYDPIFQPTGFSRSFAEMNLEEKNKISHRALAIRKLIQFLNP